jgi:hypothetical protein
MADDFSMLTDFMAKIPAIKGCPASGHYDDGLWWVKFQIEIGHPLYLNGGPKEFLSWVIETFDKDFSPKHLSEWLEARMPRPVDDLTEWTQEES